MLLNYTIDLDFYRSQNLPELSLNIIPVEVEVVDKPCRVFSYSTQAIPLDAKQAAMSTRKVHDGIPYQDTFRTRKELIKVGVIQPGCQVLLSGEFLSLKDPSQANYLPSCFS
jgi:hypothetical protein